MNKIGHRLGQRLRNLSAFWRKLVNLRNFRILFKAIRHEPPDLIFENFAQLLHRRHGQSVYTLKFFQENEHLKVYLLDSRKEAGILKVSVWVLARDGIKQVQLSAGGELLPVRPESFLKPELAALFADFSAYEQAGFLLQFPYKGAFEDIELHLLDGKDQQLSVPAGRFFQYPAGPEQAIPEISRAATAGLLVILHDWHMAGATDDKALSAKVAQLTAWGIQVLVCQSKPWETGGGEEARRVSHQALQERLLELDPENVSHLLLLAQDVLPAVDFFQQLLSFLKADLQTDILYFDEDIQSKNGNYHSPGLKPAFSPEYLAADNYIGCNYCISSRLGRQLGWFSAMDFRSGAYHFLLRAMEAGATFTRLPGVRLHRPEQNMVYFTRKEAAEIQARTAHFLPKKVSVNPGLIPGSSEILRPLNGQPKVSIIIPFRDQRELLEKCLESIFSKTRYPDVELLLISNNSQEQATYDYLESLTRKHPEIRWFRRDHPFNYSRLNNWAARQARGELLLLLNNDVQVITSGWLLKMLSYFAEDRVGAVGVKLLYPDHTVQHAGIVTGIGGIAGHVQKHYPDHYGGYDGRLNKVQNVSACTAACLMLRRSVFETVGGMNEKDLPVAFNDVDLCLEIHRAGYRIVYTPFVKLFHYESISRGAEDTPAKRKRAKKEIRFFRKKWRNFIKNGDPFYHPDLSKRMADFEDERIMGI